MCSSEVHFHSILLRAGSDAFLDNHRAYCARWGYAHRKHAIGTPGNSARTLLIYKYSVIHGALADAADGTLMIFADDDAAFCTFLPAQEVIGEATHWIARNSVTDRPEGNLVMLRAGAPATALLDAILDRLRAMPDAGTDRWAHLELEGIAAHPHDNLLEGRYFPNLLFARFGHYLPDIAAFALSFNPTVHPDTQDVRLRRIFVAHLTKMLEQGTPVFSGLPTPPTNRAAYEAHNPGRPIALLTSYTPNIAAYASIAERNVGAYAARHGYTHHVYRELPASLPNPVAGNWVKPQLLLRHLANHEHVAWVDADILIHDIAKPINAILRGRPMALARDVSNYFFNSGFMVFSNTPACRAYLERVQAMIDEVADKSDVYASGGDQSFFIAAWLEAGGAASMPLSDCVSFNSHPALFDEDSFMLHYMSYPNRYRALVMQHDSHEIERRHALP